MNNDAASSVDEQTLNTHPRTRKSAEPAGLGGWLILPLLHVAVLLGLNLYVVVQTLWNYQSLFAIAAGGTDQLAAMRLPAALSMFAALLVIIPAAAGLYAMLVLSLRAPRLMFAFYLVSFAASGLEASARTMMAQILDARADRFGQDRISTTIMCSVAGIVYFRAGCYCIESRSSSSLRAKRSNLAETFAQGGAKSLNCFASLAMTGLVVQSRICSSRSRRVANTFGPRKADLENEVSETFA